MTDDVEIIGPSDVGPVHTPRAATPTEVQYTALQKMFDYFNLVLFDGRLPPCMITLQRKANMQGSFAAKQFTLPNGEETTDEIALNPRYFHLLGAREICATLVHEMCHQLQYHFGKPMKNGYHDLQWGAAMKAVGLWPSHNGKPGGRETGVHMADYIIEGGPFALAFELLEPLITWGDVLTTAREAPTSKPKRIKLVCPVCEFGIQAVPSAEGILACIPCSNTPLIAAA